jgi:hypothetical protein
VFIGVITPYSIWITYYHYAAFDLGIFSSYSKTDLYTILVSIYFPQWHVGESFHSLHLQICLSPHSPFPRLFIPFMKPKMECDSHLNHKTVLHPSLHAQSRVKEGFNNELTHSRSLQYTYYLNTNVRYVLELVRNCGLDIARLCRFHTKEFIH